MLLLFDKVYKQWYPNARMLANSSEEIIDTNSGRMETVPCNQVTNTDMATRPHRRILTYVNQLQETRAAHSLQHALFRAAKEVLHRRFLKRDWVFSRKKRTMERRGEGESEHEEKGPFHPGSSLRKKYFLFRLEKGNEEWTHIRVAREVARLFWIVF